MLKNENPEQNDLVINNKINNAIFSFGKVDNINENCNNEINNNFVNNENKNNIKEINDKDNESNILKYNSIFRLLNINKFQAKENNLPLLNINNIDQANNSTKPKLELIKNDFISPKKNNNQINYYKILDNKNKNKIKERKEKSVKNDLSNKKTISSFKAELRNDIIKIFKIKSESDLSCEIKYLLDFPEFNYDFEHQTDINSNYQYITENFIDLLLKSHRSFIEI